VIGWSKRPGESGADAGAAGGGHISASGCRAADNLGARPCAASVDTMYVIVMGRASGSLHVPLTDHGMLGRVWTEHVVTPFTDVAGESPDAIH